MDSQSLLNGLKDLFHSLGAKTSDSNYGVMIADKSSQEPKGVMGMSDLASVLGAKYIAANVTTLNALINLLCDHFESRYGVFSVCGSWTNHANGYHALIISADYGGGEAKISGTIYDWPNAKAYLFEAMRQDAQNWYKKISSEISLS